METQQTASGLRKGGVMGYRKKYPDALVVKCNRCKTLYTYRRVSKTSKSYYLTEGKRACGERCFEPSVVCRSLDGFPGTVRIFPDFIILTAS